MYNTGNAVPSTAVKDLYDNSITEDEFCNSDAPTTVTRTGKLIKTMAGMNLDIAQAIQAVGYVYLGDYQAGLNVSNYNQVFRYLGEFWKPAPTTMLPYITTGVTGTDIPLFVAVGDATLRTALAAANGTTIIGFGDRTLFQKLGEHVSCKDAPFNCKGDGVTDDTAGLIAFANYMASLAQSGPTSSGPLSSSYTGTYPTAYIPFGTYRKSGPIPWGPYTKIVGENSIIKEYDDNADGFVVDLYQFEMSGIQFVGGRQQLVFSNANINSSMIKVDNCQFFLSRHYSVKTLATGGVYSHLSCNATFSNCRWISCHQVMDNCCDSMSINDCWVQPDVTNLSASTAVFNNRGATVIDPHAQTRLFINRGFYIPAVGEYGVDRPANIRWVDNYGSFISKDARYGGEFGGMRTVDNLAVPDTLFPWNKTEVSVTGGLCFTGPAADPVACLMGIQGQVPNSMTFGDFSGMVSSPLIRNISSTDLAVYFAAFESGSGKLAVEYFKIHTDNIQTDLRAYVPDRPMLPDGLYKYLIRGRNTRVSKVTQNLVKGTAVSNIVSFNTVTDFDAVAGAFVPGTPTRINMPDGCSVMDVEVQVVIDAGDSLAKPIYTRLIDSGGNAWKGESQIYGYDGRANPFGDRINFQCKVFGPPGSYWELNISHGATTDRNLLDARVVMTPVNMIV